MADRKISELTNITGANLANADEFVIVDTSADETKAITFAELTTALQTSLDDASGFVRITGDTMTGTLNSQAISPTANDTYSLGTASNRFKDVYVSESILINENQWSSGSPDANSIAAWTSTYGGFAIGSGTAQSDYWGVMDSGNSNALWSVMSADNDGTYIVFNNGGRDADFRIESSNVANMFYIDAANDRLGIATSPSARLHVRHGTVGNAANGIRMDAGAQVHNWYLESNTTSVFNIGSTAGTYKFRQSNGELMRLTSGAAVFNEEGYNRSFRVESDAITHALYLEGSNGYLGLRTSTPQAYFDIHTTANRYSRFISSAADLEVVTDNNTNPAVQIKGTGSAKILNVLDGTDQAFTIYGDGTSVFNEAGGDRDFRIESDSNENMFLLDAGQNVIKIGTSNDPTSGTFPTPSLYLKQTAATNGFDGIQIEDDGTNAVHGIGWTTAGDFAIASSYRSGTTYRDTVFNYGTNSMLRIATGGSGATIVNDASQDVDFRVESNNNSFMLFVDAGNDKVFIGDSTTATNGTKLNVTDDQQTTWASTATEGIQSINLINNTNTAGQHAGLHFRVSTNNTSNNAQGSISLVKPVAASHRSKFEFNLRANSGARYNYMSLHSEEGVIVNETGTSFCDFRVETDNKANMLFIDAGNDAIVVGGTNSQPAGSSFFRGMQTIHIDASRNGLYLWSEEATNTHYNAVIGNKGATNQRLISFFHSGTDTEVGSIRHDTTGTNYLTTSDRRLKFDIGPITDGTQKLMEMNPVTHKWKSAPDGDPVHGFIAQEIQKVVPEAVGGEDGGEEMMSMDYGRITPVLVAALQDAHKKIEELTAEIKAIKEAI